MIDLFVLEDSILGINLTAESRKGQLDAYIKNTQWDLIGKLPIFSFVVSYCSLEFSVMNNALKYDCCPTLYPFVLFTIRIRRRSLYYVTNVVGKRKKIFIGIISSLDSTVFSH